MDDSSIHKIILKMSQSFQRGDYCIQIDFEKGSENPSRIFRSMSDLIESFQEIDIDLGRSVATNIEPVLVLEEVEAGSIRAWLRTILRSVDDETLKTLDWKPIVGNYLVKGKKKILEFLGDKEEIKDQSQIHELEKDLLQMAEETKVRQIPAYSPVPAKRLLHDLSRLSESVFPLFEKDTATFISEDHRVAINKSFRIPSELIDEFLTRETIRSQAQMILRVKKPDYLGQSMWELKHEDRAFPAKILDEEWLMKFQHRKVLIQPGDSIRALVEIRVNYDESGEVVSSTYAILEVLEVINVPPLHQTSLLPP